MDQNGPETGTRRRGRPGRVGVETFEQVEKLIADEGLSRSQAFERLSEQTGRQAGTISANYYRIARQRGAPLRQRRPRTAGTARTRGRRGGAGDDVEAVLRRVTEAVQELGGVVRRQQRDLDQLREQAAQVDRLRTWMSKNM